MEYFEKQSLLSQKTNSQQNISADHFIIEKKDVCRAASFIRLWGVEFNNSIITLKKF